jgi:alanine dehydrogenase
VASFLADNDIVVTCVLQDPGAPLIFVTEDDLQAFAPGALLVDVSCDEGMGFSWARTTSFTEPVIQVGNGVFYYAWTDPWHGTRTPQSLVPSRFATASSRTPPSCPSNTVEVPIRTP